MKQLLRLCMIIICFALPALAQNECPAGSFVWQNSTAANGTRHDIECIDNVSGRLSLPYLGALNTIGIADTGTSTFVNLNNRLYVDGVMYPTIQSAVNALPASGGTIWLPCGLWTADLGGIDLGTHSDVVFEGCSADVPANSRGTSVLITGAKGIYTSSGSQQNVYHFRDFQLQIGNAAPNNAIGFDLTNMGQVHMDNVTVRLINIGTNGGTGGFTGIKIASVTSQGWEFTSTRVWADSTINNYTGMSIASQGNMWGGQIQNVANPVVTSGGYSPKFSGTVVQGFSAVALNIAGTAGATFDSMYFEHVIASQTVTLTCNTNVVTANFPSNHPYGSSIVGAVVKVTNAVDAAYDGSFTVASEPDQADLTWSQTCANGSTTVPSTGLFVGTVLTTNVGASGTKLLYPIIKSNIDDYDRTASGSSDASASTTKIVTYPPPAGEGTTFTIPVAATMATLTIGGGTPILKHLSATASLNFASAAANTCSADLTITVTGAALGDTVAIGVPNGSVNAGSIFYGWVSAASTVTIRHCNLSAGANDPASGTFRADVWQH